MDEEFGEFGQNTVISRVSVFSLNQLMFTILKTNDKISCWMMFGHLVCRVSSAIQVVTSDLWTETEWDFLSLHMEFMIGQSQVQIWEH